VHTIDRQRSVVLERKGLQDAEDLQNGDATGTWRWHAIHGIATIGTLERLALLGFVGCKVRSGQITWTCGVLPDRLDHIFHKLSAVKCLGPLGCNQLQHMGVVEIA
jgi:hypothetical protein